MKSYAQRADELKRQQVEEAAELRRRQRVVTEDFLREVGTEVVKIDDARSVLSSATAVGAPRTVIDALCKWIGDLEKAARNASLLMEEES